MRWHYGRRGRRVTGGSVTPRQRSLFPSVLAEACSFGAVWALERDRRRERSQL